MSEVTNIILSLPSETDNIRQMNQYFEIRNIKGLVSIDSEELPKKWYGGVKFFEANIYIGAFNHLDLEDFLNHVKSIDWEYCEIVQILIKEEQNHMFRLINLFPEG